LSRRRNSNPLTFAVAAVVWFALGAVVGAVEGLLVAHGHGYYFHSVRSLVSFLFAPAAVYAVAGVLLGALIWLVARTLTRRAGRAALLSASLGLPVMIILLWGSALGGRFFGTVGNALGHIGMVGSAVAAFLLARRLLGSGRTVRALPLIVPTVAILAVCSVIGLLALPHGSPAGVVTTGADPDAAGRPDVLLVTIDTLRADRTGYSGYVSPSNPGDDGLGTTPALDALAAAGTVFTNTIVPEVVTDPSHASLLTGVPPWEHGVFRNTMPLRTDVPVLAEAFAAAGYTTAGFVSVEHLDGHISHLSRGFERYSDCGWEDRFRHHIGGKLLERHAGSLFGHERDARDVCGEAATWLLAQRGGGERSPFFAWVHVFDPHMPYVNHETGRMFGLDERAAYAEQVGAAGAEGRNAGDTERGAATGEEVSTVATACAAYDSEVRFADDGLGMLLETLAAGELMRRTVVCVTSDHGEHMGESHVPPESWFAHVDVFDEVCRVPLVVAGPGVARGLIERQVSSMDIAATLLDLAGVDGGLGEGVALLAGAAGDDDRDGGSGRGGAGGAADSMLGTTRPLVTLANPHRDLDHRSVRDGDWKLMERGGLPVALFDLTTDPGETLNVIQSAATVVARLGAVLSETPTPEGFSSTREAEENLDPALREMLEALGYVQ